jgi:hypothetical protein
MRALRHRRLRDALGGHRHSGGGGVSSAVNGLQIRLREQQHHGDGDAVQVETAAAAITNPQKWIGDETHNKRL